MPVTSVLGAHWGDEGKGKVAAALSADAAICARFQGGPNAAHTVWRHGAHEPVVLRMVPSGVIAGATGVIGRGCVVEPRMLLDEVDRLADHGIDVARSLVVSDRAHVITGTHRGRSGSCRAGTPPRRAVRPSRDRIRCGPSWRPSRLRPASPCWGSATVPRLTTGCCVPGWPPRRARADAATGQRVRAAAARARLPGSSVRCSTSIRQPRSASSRTRAATCASEPTRYGNGRSPVRNGSAK